MAEMMDQAERRCKLLLLVLSLAYILVFGKLAFDQHAAMRTHQADLGQIDQAIWNSSRGRLLEFSKDERQSIRLTDHVEPIFVLISPLFWLWDDVRALLALQAVFVAAGAWPLYALARRKGSPNLALALAVAWLLAPPLQSALLTDFHAIPLAVPFILWAFWAVEARRWGQFAVAVLLLTVVKEEAALLAAGLGLWALWVAGRRRLRAEDGDRADRGWLIGLILALVAFAWFLLATFVIIPAYAAGVYGIDASIYFHRYGALGDSLTDILRNLVLRPGLVANILLEPARLRYLLGLFAAFGFLGLAGLDAIVLCLPLLLANLLSAYPAQYYGEFHYTAPLLPYFAVGAAYGSGRLLKLRLPNRFLIIWLLAWAVGLYGLAGRGPLGGRYDPATITAHHRLLNRFTQQLPANAAVSATAAVHPHISHRRFAFPFPNGLQQAEWALIDVTTATDMAPGDVREAVIGMLAGAWGVADAADGILLLHKGASAKTIPIAFYDFARQSAAEAPAAPLTLLAVEISDRPLWRQSQIITRWQVGKGFATNLRPWIEILTPNNERVYAFDDLAPPALIWYPPADWRPGEIVTIATTPLSLPRTWGVGAGLAHGPNPMQPADRLPLAGFIATPTLVQGDRLALVAAYRRHSDGDLRPLDQDAFGAADFGAGLAPSVTATAARFLLPSGDGIDLQARLPDGAQPSKPLELWLRWPDGIPDGYVAFVHLRHGDETISQADGPPRLFFAQPEARPANDWRQLPIPPGLSPGTRLQVAVGLYSLANGRRLELADADGRPAGNELNLGQVRLAPPSLPDQACALIPATCAGQP
jgi:uncharacterized membrane protein